MSNQDMLLYEKKDRIVTITLNRPDKMNALSEELSDKVFEAFKRFNSDDDAVVAIVTGSSAMLAESIHSFADTTNQLFLLVGLKKSERAPDTLHPFGFSG